MPLDSRTFSGKITIPTKIIDDLSSGLYHTPWACLKELVNNSYDARASQVNIFVKPDADRIIVEDDGDGMSKDEFTRHFDRISESHKRDASDITRGKPPRGSRPKIGKIGIGFIAINEICNFVEIYSTKKESEELLHVTINFEEMRKPSEERKQNGDEFENADYEGEILETDKDSHYTQLFLTEVRGESKEIMASADAQNTKKNPYSLYGLKAETVAKVLKNPKLTDWKEFDSYSETMLNIGLNVPVKYHENWIPDEYKNLVRDFEEKVESLGFEVFYDGTELKKPIVFNPPNQSMLIDLFDYEGENVSAKGYFYAQHGTIKPNELHGLLIRIRNAAVGEYDHTFWGFPLSESPLIQRWVSAEIWADDRLEKAMNIDRRTLRIAHPAYVELRKAIHEHLRIVLKRATKEFYKAGSEERKKNRRKKLIESVKVLVNDVVAPVSQEAALNLNSLLKQVNDNKTALKSIEKKYSLPEFYESIVKTGKEVLPPKQLAEFLERLTERFGDE